VGDAAAAVALVVPEPEDGPGAARYAYDLGQASAIMVIDAVDLGVGGVLVDVSDPEAAARILALPSGQRCTNVLALGYPSDGPLDTSVKLHRRPFEEIVHFARW
jgi:hypothetical protein